MTVGELLRKMSASELHEWRVYSGIDPFGEERADLRSGIVASTIASVHRKKGSRRPTPQDFMPKFGDAEQPKQSVQVQRVIFEQLNVGFQKLFGEDADG